MVGYGKAAWGPPRSTGVARTALAECGGRAAPGTPCFFFRAGTGGNYGPVRAVRRTGVAHGACSTEEWGGGVPPPQPPCFFFGPGPARDLWAGPGGPVARGQA